MKRRLIKSVLVPWALAGFSVALVGGCEDDDETNTDEEPCGANQSSGQNSAGEKCCINEDDTSEDPTCEKPTEQDQECAGSVAGLTYTRSFSHACVVGNTAKQVTVTFNFEHTSPVAHEAAVYNAYYCKGVACEWEYLGAVTVPDLEMCGDSSWTLTYTPFSATAGEPFKVRLSPDDSPLSNYPGVSGRIPDTTTIQACE